MRMKYIKIFLTSSISEFKSIRRELGDYIRKLNNVYLKRNIYFELKICEDFSDSLAAERKQEEYNTEIRECQYFYIIFGKEAGKYSIEEFNVALEQFKKTGAPQIYTYFQILPDEIDVDESVKAFITKLDSELNHYYSRFSHLDTIKLNILLELTRNIEVGGNVKFEDGIVNLDGESILSLEKVPLYSKNIELQKLRTEKCEKEQEFTRLLNMFGTHPDNDIYRIKIEENISTRYELQKQINAYEEKMFDLCVKTENLRTFSSSVSWRQREAIKYVDMGDYEGALNVLQDSVWSQEKEHAKAIIESAEALKARAVHVIEDYVSGKRFLISTIALTGITEEVEEKIIDIYQDIIPDVLAYKIQLETVFEYACFLRNHNRHKQAISVLKQVIKIYEVVSPNSREMADVKYLLACILYKINKIDDAKKIHMEALELRKQLKESGDALDLLKYAQSCNQLGYLMFRISQLDVAEMYYTIASDVQSELQDDYSIDRKNILRDYALTLNNLAILYERKGRLEISEKIHKKALKIRKTLADDKCVESLGYLAMSYLNYAKFLAGSGKASTEISSYFENAIKIYDDISRKDSKHKIDSAIAGYYYACFLEKEDKHKAIQLHESVLRRRLELAIENREALLADLSDSYYAVGRLQHDLGNDIESRVMLDKAVVLKKQLSQNAPEKHDEGYREIVQYMEKIFQNEEY